MYFHVPFVGCILFAQCLAGQWIHVNAHLSVVSGRISSIFSVKGSSDPAVDSRPALLGIFASCSMEKCAQSMLRSLELPALVALGIWTLMFSSPLHLTVTWPLFQGGPVHWHWPTYTSLRDSLLADTYTRIKAATETTTTTTITTTTTTTRLRQVCVDVFSRVTINGRVQREAHGCSRSRMAATTATATFDAQARTSDRRNGPCRVSALQRTAPEDGKGRSVGSTPGARHAALLSRRWWRAGARGLAA